MGWLWGDFSEERNVNKASLIWGVCCLVLLLGFYLRSLILIIIGIGFVIAASIKSIITYHKYYLRQFKEAHKEFYKGLGKEAPIITDKKKTHEAEEKEDG